jgi:hypothetical protein
VVLKKYKKGIIEQAAARGKKKWKKCLRVGKTEAQGEIKLL